MPSTLISRQQLIQQMLGSILEHKRLSAALGSSISVVGVLDQKIQRHVAELEPGREVVLKIAQRLCSLVEEYHQEHDRPIITPVDINIFMTTGATRRNLEASDLATTDPTDPKQWSSSPLDQNPDEVVVGETVLDLEGDDLGAIADALNDNGDVEVEDDDSGFTIWEAEIEEDVEKMCTERGLELFRLIMAIQLEIRRAVSDSDGREYSLDRKWYRQLNTVNKAKMEAEGGRQLREVTGFGRKVALEGFFAIGVSRTPTVRN